jgi:hypothetical protein
VSKKTVYILLTKHITPGGDVSTWKVFNDLESARIASDDEQRRSNQYSGLPLIAPRLIQQVLLETVEVLLP